MENSFKLHTFNRHLITITSDNSTLKNQGQEIVFSNEESREIRKMFATSVQNNIAKKLLSLKEDGKKVIHLIKYQSLGILIAVNNNADWKKAIKVIGETVTDCLKVCELEPVEEM